MINVNEARTLVAASDHARDVLLEEWDGMVKRSAAEGLRRVTLFSETVEQGHRPTPMTETQKRAAEVVKTLGYRVEFGQITGWKERGPIFGDLDGDDSPDARRIYATFGLQIIW